MHNVRVLSAGGSFFATTILASRSDRYDERQDFGFFVICDLADVSVFMEIEREGV